MKQTGKCTDARCHVFRHFCKWNWLSVCEDIHSPKLLIQYVNQPPRQILYTVLVWGCGRDICTSDCASLLVRQFNKLITMTSLNPVAFCTAAALSRLWRSRLVAVGASETGTNMSVSVGGKRGKESRGAKDRRGREREGLTGQQERCGGSMSASDKGISLPPVGQSERLTLQACTPPRTHAHTHLSVDVSFSVWD